MKMREIPKDSENAYPIPPVWRATFSQIILAFVRSDYTLSSNIPGVSPVSDSTAEHISEYIRGYGETLIGLPDETWQTSICQWMENYWEVLIDLWTEREGPSDLVLSARVTEEGAGYCVQVGMVYVP